MSLMLQKVIVIFSLKIAHHQHVFFFVFKVSKKLVLILLIESKWDTGCKLGTENDNSLYGQTLCHIAAAKPRHQ